MAFRIAETIGGVLDPPKLLEVMPVSLFRKWVAYFQLQHHQAMQQSLEADVKARMNG